MRYTKLILELCSFEISVNFFSLANSSYSLHSIKLKLDYLLDHGVEQRILFRGYSTPNIKESYAPLKIFVNFSFLTNFSYSLHPIKLKLCK